MNREEIKQGKDSDIRVVAQCLGPHVRADRPGQRYAKKRGCPEERGAVASVEVMALPKQRGLGLAESIEDAVSDVKQPRAKGKKERLGKGQVKMHSADEEPGPKSRNRRRIQT